MVPDLAIWLAHFDYHAAHRRGLPEELPGRLSAEERRCIARSLATFQLGEQSDGAALRRAARRFESDNAAAPIARIIDHLIQEEQHHAALIGAYMQENDLPRRRRDWTDRAFRWLRQRGGFELHVAVLLSAELVGHVYYRALERATGCQRLRLLCRMLVADELAHVAFEADLLLALRSRRSPMRQRALALAQRLFFIGTALVVWFTHRPVLRRACYGAGSFLRDCRSQYDFYLERPRDSAVRAAKPSGAGGARAALP